MKIAITGKGGTGKTTLAANLACWLAQKGKNVLAVDADPDASLGTVLGISEDCLASLKPIVEMKELIEERTGGAGSFYPLNPKVDDILDDYCIELGALRFLRMGNVKGGGSSCYCRENSFLKALVGSLILEEKDNVILDMGAGIEPLTRGTALGVDVLVILTEPTKVSVQTVRVIQALARDLGIPLVGVVGNKIRSDKDTAYLKEQFPPEQFFGVIPYSEKLLDLTLKAETNGKYFCPMVLKSELQTVFEKIVSAG